MTPAPSCRTPAPALQYAYMVSTGGDTDSNITNSNALLMGALGPRQSVGVNLRQWSASARRLSLAAYARQFHYGQRLYLRADCQVGSTATNDAPAPVKFRYELHRERLGHAFANALSLADGVHFNNTAVPTGHFLAVMPSYSTSVIRRRSRMPSKPTSSSAEVQPTTALSITAACFSQTPTLGTQCTD